MKVLFMFLDGVGLGEDNPATNPLAGTPMPSLEGILGGQKLVANGYQHDQDSQGHLLDTGEASLLALDACLGIEGIPQSATGQASLLSGRNASSWLGYHDGPKPSPAIVELIGKGTILSQLQKAGKSSALVNAFPPRYFQAIEAGYRIPGVIALATGQAGIHLKTKDDLFAGEAISADFTAQGWRERLDFQDAPLLSLDEAGKRLASLAGRTDLTIFEYWLTDMAGHHQDMRAASELLRSLDAVLEALVDDWDHENGLILLTSDHGNFEDMSTRHHTRNDVPLLLIGSADARERFIHLISQGRSNRRRLNLTDVAPAILNFIGA